MRIRIEQFSDFFGSIYQDNQGKPIGPFPWQKRLAEQVFQEGWPDCIDLPTASGKTACIDIAVFVMACQANMETCARTVGRRIFFTVNRRVIVDEAYDRSHKLALKLRDADSGILKEVADALRHISGDKTAPPLDVTQLRGGIYRDRAWARSITQPLIICTTADQLGSRILFRGYGVSDSMKPVHAALTACDSLILLDEAHVTTAFSQTLQLVERYRRMDKISPPMRFVQMTATPAGDVPDDKRFDLKDENWDDSRNAKLRDRQNASKEAKLIALGKRSVVDNIVGLAMPSSKPDALISDTRAHKVIGIIVNRVRTAREVHEKLRKTFGENVHLVIGRMRPIDRDDLQARLRKIVGPDRPELFAPDDDPVFVVATQCLEVGADYDFDALITECASIDALRQRFGRLNRRGRPIRAVAAIVSTDESVKGDDPIYGDALKNTWDWLWSKKNDMDQIDFGIGAFKALWQDIGKEQRKTLLAPAPDAAVLLPAHLDFLCQTAPLPEPNPDVSYFIHGPQSDNAEVNICWRADLGNDEVQWKKIVAILPPISPECMTVPLHEVRQWMKNEKPTDDADIPIISQEEAPNRNTNSSPTRTVIIYRGKKEVLCTNNPSDLRPGDTIVIAASTDPTPTLGHIPLIDDQQELDVAERAYEKARRLRVIRVHEMIHPKLPMELKDYATSTTEAFLSKKDIRAYLGDLAKGFSSGPDEIDYPYDKNGNRSGLLLRFNALLPDDNPLRLPDIPEDDGEDSSIESTNEIYLEKHTKDVSDGVIIACDQLHLTNLHAVLVQSADFHDLGKADLRFNAMLAGITPFEAMERPRLLAKSGKRLLSQAEYEDYRNRAMLPPGFRHEMLSVQIVEHFAAELLDPSIDRDLILHLIAAHHGHARPFAPVVIDEANDETRAIRMGNPPIQISSEQRRAWGDVHRLDSGVAERFWNLTRKYGWWGLAWLESILRLADQQASAAEEKEVR